MFLIKLKKKKSNTKAKANTVKRFLLKCFFGNSVSIASWCKIAAFWKTKQWGFTAPSTLHSYCSTRPGQGLLNAHAQLLPCNEKPGYMGHWTRPFKENHCCKALILSSKVSRASFLVHLLHLHSQRKGCL